MRHFSEDQVAAVRANCFIMRYRKSVPQGAATTVWAAVASELEGKGGLYLDDCQIAGPYVPTPDHHGPGGKALDIR
jgi:hypothetical protein